jgi:hypothetical protein
MVAALATRNSWFYAINDWSRGPASYPSSSACSVLNPYADFDRRPYSVQHCGQRHSSVIRPSRVGWRVRRQAAFSPIELRSGSVGGDSAPQSTQ